MNARILSIALACFASVGFVACTETLPPDDSNLPASGAPQAWENTMPGMGGMTPQDR